MTTNKNKKFIIGAGISGLVWKFYHPEFELIAPIQDQPLNKPDQFTRSNMVWLHDCWETRKLLKDLEFEEVQSRKCIIGYCVDKWITDVPTPEINLQLIQKKMTLWNKKIDIDFVPSSKELSMTSDVGVNYMNVLSVDLNEVIRRLRNKCPITHGYVHFVSADLIGISNVPDAMEVGLVYNTYEKLISTIPANKFWENWKASQLIKDRYRNKWDSIPITNVIIDEKPLCFDDKYEMIYYGANQHFSRISHIDKTYTLEFTGTISARDFEDHYPLYRIKDIFTVPQGRIISEECTPPTENIIFSGRFAQWNHAITTEHVVHQAMNYRS